MDDPRNNTNRRSGYLNAVLTAIAVLLTLLVVDRHAGPGITGAALAQGQPEDPSSSAQAMVSAAEQRKQMIAELRRIAGRMERIEAKLNAGLTVKVSEMPAAKPEGKP